MIEEIRTHDQDQDQDHDHDQDQDHDHDQDTSGTHDNQKREDTGKAEKPEYICMIADNEKKV